MKKVFPVILTLALLISTAVPSVAASSSDELQIISLQTSGTKEKVTETANIILSEEEYQVTKTEYDVGTANNYCLVEVRSEEIVVVVDSRNGTVYPF